MLITVFVYIYYSAALRVLIITLKLHSEERKIMHSWYQTSRQNSTSFNHKCKYKFLLCFKFDVNEELLLNILYVKVLINIKNKKKQFLWRCNARKCRWRLYWTVYISNNIVQLLKKVLCLQRLFVHALWNFLRFFYQEQCEILIFLDLRSKIGV